MTAGHYEVFMRFYLLLSLKKGNRLKRRARYDLDTFLFAGATPKIHARLFKIVSELEKRE